MNVMFGLFNLGGGEIILILALILILFGARKLPELAKGLGQGIREFKKNINDATREVTAETREPESQSRLTAAELEQRRAVDETERQAPRRLL